MVNPLYEAIKGPGFVVPEWTKRASVSCSAKTFRRFGSLMEVERQVVQSSVCNRLLKAKPLPPGTLTKKAEFIVPTQVFILGKGKS